MRKNAKKILVGAVLILTLVIFTACGSSNNNADEVEKENNKTTEENVAENESVDKNDTDSSEKDEKGTDEKPSDDRENRWRMGKKQKKEDSNNDGTVSGELGNSVKDLGEGVGNAVEDVGDAVGNATEGR